MDRVARAAGGRLALADMSKSNPTALTVPYYYGTCKFFLKVFFGETGKGRKEPVARSGSCSGKGGFDRIDRINRISLNKGVSGLRRLFAILGGIEQLLFQLVANGRLFNPKGIGSFSPGLVRFREGLPWVITGKVQYPERVAYQTLAEWIQLLQSRDFSCIFTQGSSLLATAGLIDSIPLGLAKLNEIVVKCDQCSNENSVVLSGVRKALMGRRIGIKSCKMGGRMTSSRQSQRHDG
jgi:hypothetical protein